MSAETKPNRAARRCRIKRERAVVVEGFDPPLKLYIVTTFGRALQLQSDIQATADGDTKVLVGLMVDFFDEALKRWEGVFGEDDTPVPYSRTAFMDLDQEDAAAIMAAVQNIGEAGSGNPTPATASEEASEEPPTP